MVTPNEIFGGINVVSALLLAALITYWAMLFYKHRFHSLLIKRQSNLTIFTCVLYILAEILLVIPFTLHYTDFSFLPKSVQFYSGLVVFFVASFVMYATFSTYVLRYDLSIHCSVIMFLVACLIMP